MEISADPGSNPGRGTKNNKNTNINLFYFYENFKTMRYLVRTYYEGERYYGYQRQSDVLTVEGTIINALIKTKYIKEPDSSQFKSASRTDRKVNALGNVFAFNTNKELVLSQVNSVLPKNKSIICWAYANVNNLFSPRYVKWKKYWYILPVEILKQKTSLSLSEIRKISTKFVGRHDFELFCKLDHRNTQRKINEINIQQQGNVVIFEFIAQSFLWEQVRRIMAYCIQYPLLNKKLQDTEFLLSFNSKKEDINLKPANPAWLTLTELYYENIHWIYDRKEIEKINRKTCKDLKSLKQQVSQKEVIQNFFHTIN